jgi:hypothetical protein
LVGRRHKVPLQDVSAYPHTATVDEQEGHTGHIAKPTAAQI